jgi:hypothetical protein
MRASGAGFTFVGTPGVVFSGLSFRPDTIDDTDGFFAFSEFLTLKKAM